MKPAGTIFINDDTTKYINIKYILHVYIVIVNERWNLHNVWPQEGRQNSHSQGLATYTLINMFSFSFQDILRLFRRSICFITTCYCGPKSVKTSFSFLINRWGRCFLENLRDQSLNISSTCAYVIEKLPNLSRMHKFSFLKIKVIQRSNNNKKRVIHMNVYNTAFKKVLRSERKLDRYFILHIRA